MSVFVFISKESALSLKTAALFNLAFLMLHQFEEYVHPGGFKEFFNSNIGGSNRIVKFSITDSAIIVVNVVIGWGFYTLAVLFPTIIIVMMLLMTSLVNGIVHSAALLRFRKYNPGLVTGIFLFIPFSIYSMLRLSENNVFKNGDWILIICLALGGTALIPFTIYLCRNKE